MNETAVPGAPATNGSIPLCVPEIAGNEWKYIKECLDTNWVSSVGSFVDRFEQMVADLVGAKHAIATVNGTSALHVALLVSGVQADDEVLIPTLTFVAPANTIRYCGAWPVFMDVEPRYWQIDPEKTVSFLENECQWQNGRLVNKKTGRRVAAIMPVHVLGHPCDMGPIKEIAWKFDLKIVEDATESLGAKYRGEMVGNLGDISCFSFNGNKAITTGGGGMIVTDNQDWAERAHYLTTQAKDDPIEYVHNEIGFNYRLSNISAAMGVAQMEILDGILAAKRAIACRYVSGLQDLEEITLMASQPDTEPTYWLYTMLLPEGTTLDERKGVILSLNQSGIGSRPLWHPIHGLPPYADCQSYQVETANDLYNRAVSLPSSAGLTEQDQQRSIDLVRQVLRDGEFVASH
jgi:perosamine synthetase